MGSILSQFDVKTGNSDGVGSCAHLGGKPSRPDFSPVDCSDKTANYRIVQTAKTPNDCVSDADRRYYLNIEGHEKTSCLDYNWDETSCISMTAPIPQKVTCDDKTAASREKPVKILTSTTDAHGCPSGGFAHPVRRFTVCTESQK